MHRDAVRSLPRFLRDKINVDAHSATTRPDQLWLRRRTYRSDLYRDRLCARNSTIAALCRSGPFPPSHSRKWVSGFAWSMSRIRFLRCSIALRRSTSRRFSKNIRRTSSDEKTIAATAGSGRNLIATCVLFRNVQLHSEFSLLRSVMSTATSRTFSVSAPKDTCIVSSSTICMTPLRHFDYDSKCFDD